MPDTTARLQHKAHIRRLAARLEHYARQVTLDMEHDRPFPSHGRQAAEIGLELYAELKVLAKHDEQAARKKAAA